MTGKWMSVTKQLPENGARILVCGRRGGVQTARYETRWDKNKRRLTTAFFTDSNKREVKATHWMLLPDLPSEVEE